MHPVPFRISIKINLGSATVLDAEAVIPVFHQWIQDQIFDELLIDVTDYRHVPAGPGLLLVGLEGEYGIQEHAGQIGLRYTRKRAIPSSFEEALLLTFNHVVRAGRLLVESTASGPNFPEAYTDLEIRFVDALKYPNAPAQFESLPNAIAKVLKPAYIDENIEVSFAASDARRPLTLSVEGRPHPMKRQVEDLHSNNQALAGASS